MWKFYCIHVKGLETKTETGGQRILTTGRIAGDFSLEKISRDTRLLLRTANRNAGRQHAGKFRRQRARKSRRHPSSEVPLPAGWSGPIESGALSHSSLGPPESTSQTASPSVQCRLQGSRSLQTDRQTDRQTDYVTAGCSSSTHLTSAAMWPKIICSQMDPACSKMFMSIESAEYVCSWTKMIMSRLMRQFECTWNGNKQMIDSYLRSLYVKYSVMASTVTKVTCGIPIGNFPRYLTFVRFYMVKIDRNDDSRFNNTS